MATAATTAPVTADANTKKAKKKIRWQSLPEIWALLHPRRGMLLLGLVLVAINRVAGLVLPGSSKYLFDPAATTAARAGPARAGRAVGHRVEGGAAWQLVLGYEAGQLRGPAARDRRVEQASGQRDRHHGWHRQPAALRPGRRRCPARRAARVPARSRSGLRLRVEQRADAGPPAAPATVTLASNAEPVAWPPRHGEAEKQQGRARHLITRPGRRGAGEVTAQPSRGGR